MTSPGAQAPLERLMMLSSSPLPDITEIATKKPKATALRSGSAAVPIPASASKTFTTAADLLRIAPAGVDDQADFIDEPERPAPKEGPTKRARKITKAPKRVAKEVIVLSSDGATPNDNKDGTKTRPEEDTRDGVEGSPLGAKPWRRYKAPADPGDTDVSAKTVEPPAKPKAQRKKTDTGETVSQHFTKKDGATRRRLRDTTPEPVNLEPAVQRRRDWTPPREDSHPDKFPTPLASSDTNPLPNSPAIPSPEHETSREDVFKNLHDAYAHRITTQTESAPTNPLPIALGKRKVIEMISVGQPSKQTPELSPIKQKAPKKKPRTITELATAAYAPKPVELPEDALKEDSILEYFNVDKKGNVSKATAGKGKGKTTKVTKKKAPPKQPLLLSPKAAIRQSARQDFVFGTSSQLVREESPTFLRDLQAAMRASNVITSETAQSAEDLPRTSDLALESTKRGGGLWSESARDEDGEVVNIEVIHIADSPFPEDDAVAILDPWKDLPPELPAASGTGTETAEPSLIEIESMPVATSNTSSQPPVPKSLFFLTQPKVTINTAAAAAAADSSDLLSRQSYPLITDLLQEGDVPPPSNQEQSQGDNGQISPAMPRKAQKTRPNYELYTDAKLAKEVSSFGFKAVKSRSGMLALLNQCWESRSRTPITAAPFSTSARSPSPKGKKTAPAADTAATSPAPKRPRAKTKKADAATNDASAETGRASTASPPKKRGRPRKDAAGPSTNTTTASRPKAKPAASTPKRRKTSTQPKTKIADSDLDSDDSAGFSSPEKVFTSPGGGAVDMSINEDTEITLDLSPTAQQSLLFGHITRAVTSAPRTTDPDNPSWHEKMLMYDPVILEDLAAWLNEGQLTRVGYDGEASPMDVKKWCESKSVCCLWRGTWRGKERKRL